MNIELHGFLPEHDEGIITQVWSKLQANLSKEGFADCRVTAVRDRMYDHNGRSAPFVRVLSCQESDFDLACKILKPIHMPGAGLKTFVEFVLLHHCREL